MLGNMCTRRCASALFPAQARAHRPRRASPVAYAVAKLGLKHAVITSVNRDMTTSGAGRAFVEVIEEIRRQPPAASRSPDPRLSGYGRAIRLL